MTQPEQPDAPPAPDDVRLTLVTLGEARLSGAAPAEGGGTTPASLPPGKALALLTYLHCLPGRTATREHLADRFWGDSGPDAARQALRQTIYRIRHELGGEAITSSGESITLALGITCDRDLFQDAIRAGQAAQAVEVYGGEFFPSFAAPGAVGFEQWADLERAQLQAAFLRAAESAVRQALDRTNTREAIRLARKARDLCPASELAWRLLLQALVAAGSRPAALLEADALLGRLRVDDREPEPATARLLERLRQPEAPSPPEAPPSLAARLNPELVGREREFATLLEAWQACATLGGRHVHIAGPAGLGKTRLMAELARRLRISRGRIVQVSGVAGERQRPWGFLGDLVTALGQLPGATGTAPGSLAELARLAPSLSSYLPDRATASRAPVDETARLLAVTDLMGSVAQDAPLAILLDDLHWADDESWRVVDSLVKRVGSASVLIVTASRPGHRGGPSGPPTVAVELGPLTPTGVEALLISLGADPGQPEIPRLAGILGRSSRGVPLLVLESLRFAIERGDLDIGASAWRWDNPEAVLAAFSDEDPLAHRIEELPQDARRILAWLAFAQVPLPEEELHHAGPGWAQAVAHLEQVGLISRTGKHLHPAHDEVAAAARRLAGPTEAQAVDAGLAAWFANRIEADPGAFQRAARHLRQAGDQAGVASLLRRRVQLARQRRESVSLGELAHQALDPAATSQEVDRLIRRLGRITRWRHEARPLALGATMAALVLLPLVVALARRPEAPPEALLVLAVGEGTARDPIEFRAVPVSAARWATTTAVSPDEGRFLARLPAGRVPYLTLAVHPDLGRIAFDEVTTDSGGIDIMLLDRDGGVRRLTASRGDDVHPAWSPNGELLAFATMRWPEDGLGNSAIVALEMDGGGFRRLTSGPTYDAEPRWSPDGTRLAFSRRVVEQPNTRVCWVSRDGRREHCLEGNGTESMGPLGWSGPDTVMVAHVDDAGQVTLRTWAVDAPYHVPHLVSGQSPRQISPNGDWAIVKRQLVDTQESGQSSPVLEVRSIHQPSLNRVLRTPTESGRMSLLGPPGKAGASLARLEIGPKDRIATQSISHRFWAIGRDEEGNELHLSTATMEWTTSDTLTASIDRFTGLLMPRRTGVVTVFASAAGWRRDSLLLTIEPPHSATSFEELWQHGVEDRWRFFGYPLPQVVATNDGVRALLNNGDETFDSGGMSLLSIDPRRGIGIEARVLLPITRPLWQQLRLGLAHLPRVNASGATTDNGCIFQAPAAGGIGGMTSFNVSKSGILPIPPEWTLSQQAWRRISLQLFPDGTCGLALDGLPIWRGTDGPHREGYWRVVTQGRTVGTQMLLGPLTVWTGVHTDIDWAALDRPARGAPVGPRGLHGTSTP